MKFLLAYLVLWLALLYFLPDAPQNCVAGSVESLFTPCRVAR